MIRRGRGGESYHDNANTDYVSLSLQGFGGRESMTNNRDKTSVPYDAVVDNTLQ